MISKSDENKLKYAEWKTAPLPSTDANGSTWYFTGADAAKSAASATVYWVGENGEPVYFNADTLTVTAIDNSKPCELTVGMVQDGIKQIKEQDMAATRNMLAEALVKQGINMMPTIKSVDPQPVNADTLKALAALNGNAFDKAVAVFLKANEWTEVDQKARKSGHYDKSAKVSPDGRIAELMAENARLQDRVTATALESAKLRKHNEHLQAMNHEHVKLIRDQQDELKKLRKRQHSNGPDPIEDAMWKRVMRFGNT